MTVDILRSLFNRDLLKLNAEIELYRDETNMWKIEKDILNSAGNLCLHLIGNLNAYIGVGLVKTDYIRRRDLEFSLSNVPKLELIQKIEQLIIVVDTGLTNLDENKLNENFPISIWDKPSQMLYTLIHLLTHLNYHLGQINYHRRLLDN